jgi:hypothetical protein
MPSRLRAALVTIALCLAAGACGGASSAPPSDPPARAATPTVASPAGCRATPIRRGGMPRWTAPAFADSSPQLAATIPYAVSSKSRVVAVLFGHPLRAGAPGGRGNKILWVVRYPRDGKPLHIRAVPLAGSAHAVSTLRPADSSPGEIYPSLDNVPAAGCWIFTLRWNGHADTIALRYRSSRRKSRS